MVRILLLMLVFQAGTAVTADETTRLLSSLLRRVGTLERNVEILGDQVDQLKAELRPQHHQHDLTGAHSHEHDLSDPDRTPSVDAWRSEAVDNEWRRNRGGNAGMFTNTDNEGGLDLKITEVSAQFSGEDGGTSFTLRYEALGGQPQVLVQPNHTAPPMRVDHTLGTVQFLVPPRETSPAVYIYTVSGLLYTLTLINNQPRSPTFSNVSNVAVSLSPEPPFTFEPGEDPEFTFTAAVTGHVNAVSEELTYSVYPLLEYSDVVVEMFHLPRSTSRGRGEEEEQGQSNSKDRLRVIELEGSGEEKTYRFRLDTAYEDRGVVFLEHSTLWECSGGCVLYKTIVDVPVLYYRRSLYDLPATALVPSRKGQPRQAGNYVNFISYNPNAVVADKICREGHRCLLACGAFGDHPEVTFRTNVDMGSIPGARTWSFNIGYIAHSYVVFEAVTKEAQGQYQCHASAGTVSKVRNVRLRVNEG